MPFFSRVLCIGNLASRDLLCHPHPQAGKRTKSMQCWRFHDGFFISGFPVLDGVAIWVSLLTSRAPSSNSQGVGLVSRGKDIFQAVEEGNLGAVRHFLRVDPESLEREDVVGCSLGTEVGNFGEDE